ncbi:hypothetical protein Ami103574_14495 [Aminipila butyrica]|uniref:Uncharacterized protein n=1 Tax=Aminipila butyrica TaxID=433296 RepID=A0A858BXW4_9FIRM|nr:hypothetical protein [Aminipila butyrica]QIB70427.1 hypothetical protein Ami103574_14495 [Aminipila butyrica]
MGFLKKNAKIYLYEFFRIIIEFIKNIFLINKKMKLTFSKIGVCRGDKGNDGRAWQEVQTFAHERMKGGI